MAPSVSSTVNLLRDASSALEDISVLVETGSFGWREVPSIANCLDSSVVLSLSETISFISCSIGDSFFFRAIGSGKQEESFDSLLLEKTRSVCGVWGVSPVDEDASLAMVAWSLESGSTSAILAAMATNSVVA